MPYATVLFFEEDSESIIRGIWEGLAKEDIPLDFSSDIRPHMTLGIYDELSCRLCEKGLEKLATRSANLSITFSSFGIFREPESVLFLASTTTKELLDFHAHIHSELSDWVKKPWELYLPGRWVPHCTLALGIRPDQFNKAISICSKLKLPLTLKSAQIGVVEFHPINELFKYELGKRG